jgi:acyl carrier protein
MSEAVKDTVRDRVVAILAEQAVLEPGEVRMNASLQDLGIDSLGLVEAVFAIEEAFDIQVPFNANDPSASEFDISSVQSMVRAVETLIAAQN